MTQTMLAATLNGYGQPLRIEKVARPIPGPGQILVQLEASGVCHTDVHVWKGGLRSPSNPIPFVLGHEGVGRVAALSAGVTDWRVGQRAGAAWIHNTCGMCDECISGEESFCQVQNAHGFNVPGTFAEYILVDARFAARLPEGDAALLAPLLCAGLTAYGGLKRAELEAGETIAIFGCGGLGLYAVQLANRMGARVIAVDRDPQKLELARSYGADVTLHAGQLSDERAHVCINFAPTTTTWDMMVAMIRPRGRIIAAAMVPELVGLNQEWLTGSGVRITGTSVGTRAQMVELLSIHSQRPLVSTVTRIGLHNVTAALQALDDGTAKGRFCIEF
jgi:alcohol dehydrogenase, propanol-preferring